VRSQPEGSPGDVVVAGIPGEEATVKTLARPRGGRVVLRPANPALDDLEFDPADVRIYGRVVTVLRRL
jgi:repressor LexA